MAGAVLWNEKAKPPANHWVALVCTAKHVLLLVLVGIALDGYFGLAGLCSTTLESWWLYALANYTPFSLVVWGTLAASMGTYWLLGSVFLLLDIWRRPEALYQFKIQAGRPFEPQGGSFNPSLTALLSNVLFNQVTQLVPACLVLYRLGVVQLGWVSLSAELPAWWVVALQLAGCVLLEEVMFFYSHRWLHSGSNYARIHKQHHHFKAPIALAASYSHPLENLLSNVVPILTGALLLRVHLLVALLWCVVAVTGTQVHHCGFRFPWTLALDHQPNFHDLHHSHFEVNYGLIGLLDRLHGTYHTADTVGEPREKTD